MTALDLARIRARLATLRPSAATGTDGATGGPSAATGAGSIRASGVRERPLTTRFAPAPTGYLHLGHVANAIFVWGVARAVGARVALRIEDHDRERCRPEFERALLDDLEWLGFVPDLGTPDELRHGPSAFRQSDDWSVYYAALAGLRAAGFAYACECSRSTFADWSARHGRPWRGPGCPGSCRERGVAARPGLGIRIVLGDGNESFDDLAVGPTAGDPSAGGDLLALNRHGGWTYPFTVVVDDLRHGIDLVVRGEDLLADTPRQIRLGRLLGRTAPPAFLHHPLVRKAGGAKLSKADGDTSIRDLRAAGATPAELIGRAAAAVGLTDTASTLEPNGLSELFGA